MKFYKTLLTTFTLFTILSTCCFSEFRINPLRVEEFIKPGDSLTGAYVLTSEDDRAREIDITADDTSSDEKLGTGWLTVSPMKVTLTPEDPVEITYTITIPEDATGEYSARIGFSEVPEEDEGMVIIRTKTTLPLYAIVDGTEIYDGEIINATVSKSNPPEFSFDVLNRGNIHVRAQGLCTVKNLRTKREKRSRISKYPLVYYPNNQVRKVTVPFDTKFGPDTYSFSVVISFPDKENSISKTFTFKVDEAGYITQLDSPSDVTGQPDDGSTS